MAVVRQCYGSGMSVVRQWYGSDTAVIWTCYGSVMTEWEPHKDRVMDVVRQCLRRGKAVV